MTEGPSDFPIPVVLMGLGHMGRGIARAALDRPDLEVVAAVDPAHAGRHLDEVLGSPAPHLPIVAAPDAAFAVARGGVVLHATGSRLKTVLPQVERAARAGLSVVSTCEELAYPWWADAEAAERLADVCEAHEVAVVGAGVNPGFVLDRLPAFLAQVTGPVRRVRARRVQDAARRRIALQRKIGAGLTVGEFEAAEARGEVGHVGLAESALLVAEGCGFDPEAIELDEEISALVAEEDLDAPVPVRAGQVAGVQQTARAYVDGVERVLLELVIQSGAEDPRDEVEIEASVPIKVTIDGGLPGEEATAWAVVNAVPAITRLRGLVTVLELPAGR